MTATPLEQTTTPTLDTLWLDLTRKCQLACTHCYNDSGPNGEHGTMTRNDWFRVIYDAAALRVSRLQIIGGEPTTHPDFAELVDHALNRWLTVEVFSNLVHVSPKCWELFQRKGVSLATSYYSDDANQHNAMTNRRSHGRTRANIAKAVKLGIPLRVGIIAADDGQRVDEAWRDLESLGVTRIHVDHVRPFGRGSHGEEPDASHLCGQCGAGKASIDPHGAVSPCVFSTWLSVGNVQDTPLRAIVAGTEMDQANASIREAAGTGLCDPDGECSPGYPDSGCSPRS
ncbi:radical SAM/SPASM domain-containing protein [Allosalinactinospora lopnorensis]|uniref:radical SAM/SPASM domain-containing protein n=1 Tax=Allosalinactinospora lopnorensis TaxID=1352348 RepID=UPI000623D21C|nr:radical SAM/SPASM domain-containing protein [Allosalinactinospora lopnorensis]